jgi:hypothetical protein
MNGRWIPAYPGNGLDPTGFLDRSVSAPEPERVRASGQEGIEEGELA